MNPPNDNFTDAIDLGNGLSGSAHGTNRDATTETEPGQWLKNPTNSADLNPVYTTGAKNTVWYKWTCPIGGDYFFATRGTDGVHITDFPSVIQVFTSSDIAPVVNNLTETPYILNQSAGFGNFELGSLVAFTAGGGKAYYIRVGSRGAAQWPVGSGGPDYQGNFFLKWDAFVPSWLGSCSGCVGITDENCIGTIRISDVKNDGLYSFGSFPPAAGYYRIRFCSGASIDYVLVAQPPYDGGLAAPFQIYDGSAYSADTVVVQKLSGFIPYAYGHTAMDVPAGIAFGLAPYYDQIIASCGGQAVGVGVCNSIDFCQCQGGDISIMWFGNERYANINNPSYQLVFNPCTIDMFQPGASPNCGITDDGGGNFHGSFRIDNVSQHDWGISGRATSGTLAFQLLNTGGISNASAAVTAALPKTSSVVVGPFSFSADKNTLVTATIQISLCGVVVGSLTFPMYPVVAFSLTQIAIETNCSGTKYWRVSVNNPVNLFSCALGALSSSAPTIEIVTATDVLSGTPLKIINNTDCSSASTTLNTGSPIQQRTIAIQAQPTARQVLVTVQAQFRYNGFAYVDLPVFQQVITVPAA